MTMVPVYELDSTELYITAVTANYASESKLCDTTIALGVRCIVYILISDLYSSECFFLVNPNTSLKIKSNGLFWPV